mgnify:CR=1 FL=1
MSKSRDSIEDLRTIDADLAAKLPLAGGTLTGDLNVPSVTASGIVSDAGGNVRAGRKNLILNGGFDVWQRGTSFTTNGYTADRWELGLSGATSTVTQQAFTLGQTEVPDNPTYYLKVDTTTADNNCGLYYRVEDVRNGAGQNVTLSFWAKGTNPAGDVFDLVSSQRFGTGGSGNVETITPLTFTSSWVKYTHTFSLASIAGKTVGAGNNLTLSIRQDGDDTSTTAWNLNIANVQLEVGSVATDFEHRSYGEELALCQRYYYKTAAIKYFNLGRFNVNTGNGLAWWVHPTTMRTTPSMSSNGTWNSDNGYSGDLGYNSINASGCTVYSTVDITSNQIVYAHGASIVADAEL